MKIKTFLIAAFAVTGQLSGSQTTSATIGYSPNIALFRINSFKDSKLDGYRVREFQLSVVKQFKGSPPNSLVFSEKMPLGVAPRVVSDWFGVRIGTSVVVGYGSDLRRVRFIELADDFAESIEFISSLPLIPDLGSTRDKIDAFVASHHGKIHTCVATYIATYITFSNWDDNSWTAYVQNNPLQLKGEPQAAFYGYLAGSVMGRELEGKTDPSVRTLRTNRISTELVAQIAANADASISNRELVNVLRTLIRQVGFRMTPATLQGIDHLLKSGKIPNDQKRAFERDITQMRTGELE